MTALQARGVHFRYGPGRPVLQGVDLDVERGRIVGLFGANGSGKSTLLRCLNNSLRPQAGEALIDGRPAGGMSRREIARRVAVVPQHTPDDLPLRVEDMVLLGRYPHGTLWGETTEDDRAVVEESLRRAEAVEFRWRRFDQLSGGERQRVVVARALAQGADILLLDEPATHLDIAHQLSLLRLLRTLADQGCAILLVSHDILVAPGRVDRAVLLADGRVAAAGEAVVALSPENLRRAFGAALAVSWSADGGVTLTPSAQGGG